MTLRQLPLMEALVSGFGRKAKGAVRRAALSAVAGVIAAIGCGFLLFAAFAALRLLVGPELAALGIGIVLLALAALLLRLVRGHSAEPLPVAVVAPKVAAPPADPITMAIFTVAFVLGRRLADRWRG